MVGPRRGANEDDVPVFVGDPDPRVGHRSLAVDERAESSARSRTGAAMGLILLIILILLLVGSLPTWGYSRTWGYRGSGLVGLLLVIFLILLLMRAIPW
jgi:hypothetical protein